jgi:hypothetical protein
VLLELKVSRKITSIFHQDKVWRLTTVPVVVIEFEPYEHERAWNITVSNTFRSHTKLKPYLAYSCLYISLPRAEK